MYKVYVHINKTNGKRYIGITSRQPEKRWNNGNGYSTNKAFYNSIKKHGWENGFEHIILADNLSAEEAAQMEKELIALYETNNPEYGYNHTGGGFGYCGFSESAELRKHLPKYEDIKADDIARALFKRLFTVAYGFTVKETTEKIVYDEWGNIKQREKKTKIDKIPPDLRAIDAIVENYGEINELSEHIARLKALRTFLEE